MPVLRAILLTIFLAASAEAGTSHPPLFHEDPGHLWNRLHRTLWVRTAASGKEFGHDRIDPLLWADTRHLLEGASHREALSVLDEFLNSHGERLIDDPVKRAMLQRDLWSVFDWSAGTAHAGETDLPRQRRALQRRLAQAICRLALFREQIADLPDTYELAVASKRFAAAYDPAKPETVFLPPDLFDRYGPWLHLAPNTQPAVAPAHLDAFGARSSFSVLFRHPTSREEGVRYFTELRKFKEPWVAEKPDDPDSTSRVINPKLPQFPAGTQVALVRRMLLPDSRGGLHVTPVIESIQLRVQREKGEPVEQDVFEFALSRKQLFGQRGDGLHAVTPDEQDMGFVQFRGHGHDPFTRAQEPRTLAVMTTCAMCHRGRGVFTMNSVIESRLAPHSLSGLFDAERGSQDRAAVTRKLERYDYGLLLGLMTKDVP